MPVAREGTPFILLGFLFLVLLILGGYKILACIVGIVTLCIIIFFRDPERQVLKDENIILSPADGQIIQIDPVHGKGNIKSGFQQISIFMSVLNCHINRVPISGRVIRCEYNPGRFLPAFKERASDLNEQNMVFIENEALEIGIRQIAGLIARRIVCRIKPGDWVMQGNRFGLIRFGSRVDLLLPSNVKLLVNLGQKVKAGLSPIAQIKS